jgi:hypothetical protein
MSERLGDLFGLRLVSGEFGVTFLEGNIFVLMFEFLSLGLHAVPLID